MMLHRNMNEWMKEYFIPSFIHSYFMHPKVNVASKNEQHSTWSALNWCGDSWEGERATGPAEAQSGGRSDIVVICLMSQKSTIASPKSFAFLLNIKFTFNWLKLAETNSFRFNKHNTATRPTPHVYGVIKQSDTVLDSIMMVFNPFIYFGELIKHSSLVALSHFACCH